MYIPMSHIPRDTSRQSVCGAKLSSIPPPAPLLTGGIQLRGEPRGIRFPSGSIGLNKLTSLEIQKSHKDPVDYNTHSAFYPLRPKCFQAFFKISGSEAC